MIHVLVEITEGGMNNKTDNSITKKHPLSISPFSTLFPQKKYELLKKNQKRKAIPQTDVFLGGVLEETDDKSVENSLFLNAKM